MREILFRGKRKDNGEWVYGNLSKRDDVKKWEYFIGQNSLGYDVIPETVGQYTGLTDDRNGKKIFEGDILRVAVKENTTICKVAFAENVAHFQLWQTITLPKTSTALNLGNYECEVIGNIHDNPELWR